MAVKVAAAGATSTGKSSFLRDLAAAVEDAGLVVGMVPDLAAEARGRGFRTRRDHTVASTLWIMAHGIALELETALAADVVLVDRPVPDALGVLQAALRYRSERLSLKDSTYLYDLARHHGKTYDIVVKTLLDPSIPIGVEQDRDPNPKFRQLTDVEIGATLSAAGVSYRHIQNSDHASVIAGLVEEVKDLVASRDP